MPAEGWAPVRGSGECAVRVMKVVPDMAGVEVNLDHIGEAADGGSRAG